MFPRYSHWTATYTRKGLLLLRLRQIFNAFALFGAFAASLYTYRYGVAKSRDALKHLVEMVREGVRRRM